MLPIVIEPTIVSSHVSIVLFYAKWAMFNYVMINARNDFDISFV
jgi:hypothetical protein